MQPSQTWLSQAGYQAGSQAGSLKKVIKPALKLALKHALEQAFNRQEALMQTRSDGVYSTGITAKTAGSKEK